MEEGDITVGICAHNEEETIGKLLEQVMEEDIPLSRIIVVVAGEDRTAGIVRRKQRKYPGIELIREENREGQTVAVTGPVSLAAVA
ncbi:MAG: glycosyltransferase family 2 protein, partial [Candidatus Nanohaloarchaea archaeon]